MDTNAYQEHDGELIQTPKRMRMSREAAALGTTTHQERYTEETLLAGGGCFLCPNATRARDDGSVRWRWRRDKAAAAADASWASYRDWAEENVRVCAKTGSICSLGLAGIGWDAETESSSSSSSSSRKPKLEQSRRHAVRFLYVQDYGRMPEEKWDNWYGSLSLPGVICRRLNISVNSLAEVKNAMRAIYQEEEVDGGIYDTSRKRGGGRTAEIIDFTPQAQAVYRILESGVSVGNAVVLLNGWRRHPSRNLEGVSYSTLRRFIKQSPVIDRRKRETRKDGSNDPDSNWCVARKVIAGQLIRQMRKGARIERGGREYVAAEDGPDRNQADLEVPIFLGAFGSYDESSKECRCGHASQTETRIRRDANGKVATEADGGVLPDVSPTQTHKFEKTAAGLFGCVSYRENNQPTGDLQAETLAPLSYTNPSGIQWVVGYDEFQAEIDRLDEKWRKSPRAHNHMPLTSGVGNSFAQQFPGTDPTNKKMKDGTVMPNWRREVGKVINERSKEPKRDVTDFMDHISTMMPSRNGRPTAPWNI